MRMDSRKMKKSLLRGFNIAVAVLVIIFPLMSYIFFTRLILWVDIAFQEAMTVPMYDIILPFPYSWNRASVITRIYHYMLIPLSLAMYYPIARFVRRLLKE